MTIDTNLHIFQYKISNNILYLNQKFSKSKILLSPLCFSCNLENETLHTFLTLAIKQNLFALNSKIYNSEILILVNMPQNAFFDFPANKENF